jgi:hypothetical protein
MISAYLDRLFVAPPRAFGPTPLWWWSGGAVTRERIRWQMQRFDSGGIHNLVVINLAPAGPTVGAMPDDPPWFSDLWWERFADTCEIAAELDMRIWFYDQIGFSGANVQGVVTRHHPEAAGRGLRSHLVRVDGGRVRLPRGHELLGAFDVSGRRIATHDDGVLDVPDDETVRAVTTVPSAFDYLSRSAVSLLLDTIHGEFDRRLPQYLGNVIAGSFQDELPATNSWSVGFAEEFRLRRGYDLLDHLALLWERRDARALKVRGDYYAVRGALSEEALFRPLAQWHEERGMLLGADQSNPARAGYPTQATQIYTDYFRAHRWYSAVGSDHEGDAKVHSSMAHLYDHERVWIESFHSSGWGGTLEDTYDWLLPFLRSGANLYNPHASYFDTHGGWFEWAPPSTDWRQPYWAHYPAFSRAVARIAAMMTWGSYDAQVAVLHPTATAQALLTLDTPVDHFGTGQLGGAYADLDRTQRDYLDLCGSNNWFHTRLGGLDRAGISFDVIDDASVQAADLDGAAFAVRQQRYSVVVLPSARVLETETARQLLRLLDAGGRVVVVGRAPTLAAGTDGDDMLVKRLARDPRIVGVQDAEAAVATLGNARGHASSDVPLLVRRDGADGVALVTAAYPNASGYPLRGDTWLWPDYDFDPARYEPRRTVRIEAPLAKAEIWDPASGVRRRAEVTRLDGRSSTVDVALDDAPAVLLVWREEHPPGGPGRDTESNDRSTTLRAAGRAGAADSTELSRTVELTDWTGELVPTMDNYWGDLAIPAGRSVAQLEVWTMGWTQADQPQEATWTEVKATFGQRVRVLDAVPVAQAPPPLGPKEVAEVLAGARPLADGWTVKTYSNSRGREKEAGLLGNKGLVPEEFVHVTAPASGEAAVVRAVVRTSRPGEADLVVGAGAGKLVWWNGREVSGTTSHASVARVTADEVNVLEYQLGPSEHLPTMTISAEPPTLGSFFALVRPGGFGDRPEFMRLANDAAPTGNVTYRRAFSVRAPVNTARLIVGAATGLSVLLDGQQIARQEKVEYYESSWGDNPMYFSHDLSSRLAPGEHMLEVRTDSYDSRDVVFVDLVVQHDGGVTVVVSGPGW